MKNMNYMTVSEEEVKTGGEHQMIEYLDFINIQKNI